MTSSHYHTKQWLAKTSICSLMLDWAQDFIYLFSLTTIQITPLSKEIWADVFVPQVVQGKHINKFRYMEKQTSL